MTQSYKTGTVTVTAGSTSVVGSGTAWGLASATGGLFCCAGMAVPCTVVDDTHLTLDNAWPGANGSGKAYSIFRETAQAASAVEANDRLAAIADRLNKLSYINFDAMGTLAQRDAYDGAAKDFIFLDISAEPFELYIKASDAAGDWAGPNPYGGTKGDPGPVTPIDFDSPDALAPGSSPTVTNTGTETAPKIKFGIPSGRGVYFRGAYAAGTSYVTDDVVSFNGSAYIALQPTTGNPPTDPTYWGLLVAKGADGTGAGDMVKATYDPTNKNADAFDMTNMVEGSDAKKMTAAERTKLAGIAAGATVTNASTVGAAIAGVSQVGAPADGDRFAGVLSGASTLFWTTFGNIKASLKTYFDGLYATTAQGALAAAALPKAGGTMTGALTLSGPTTADLHAATKKYVDDNGGGSGADSWASRPIGELIAVLDSISGVTVPPKDKAYRYVLLTAGQTGVGAYNEGILTSETVTGSAPLVGATAVVNLVGSPINGQTIRLINTERRFLRAGNAGTVENDQMQAITGSLVMTRSGAGSTSGALSASAGGTTGLASGSTSTAQIDLNSANSPGARAGDETRAKNIGVTYYMRIK